MADYIGKAVAYNGHPMYEGRPVGQFNDPAGTAADFVFNAGYDFIDMAKGLGTTANLATARFYEGVPTPQNHGMIKPWIRPAEDFNTGVEMGKAIIGNYAHSYVDPILQGRPLDLSKHAMAHPVNTLLDLTAVGGLLRLPKLMGKAAAVEGAAAVAPVVGEDSGVLSQIIQEANAAKDKAVAKVGEIADQVKETGQVEKAIVETIDQVVPVSKTGKMAAEITKDFKNSVLAEDIDLTDNLGKLWGNIKNKDEVQAYAEGWHPNLIEGKGMPDDVAKYLAHAEEYSKIMRGRIEKFTNPLDLELDKYQPAAIKLNGFTTADWQGMSRKTQLDILNFTKMQMQQKGITPQYSPHVMKGEANRVLRSPTTMQQDFTKDPSKAHFLKTKQSAGDKAIKSHFDSMRVRWLQISQFQQAYEKIIEHAFDLAKKLDELENAPDAAARQLAGEVKAAMEEAATQATPPPPQVIEAPSQSSPRSVHPIPPPAPSLADQARKALEAHLNEPAKSIAEQMADKGYTAISGQDLFDTVLGPLKGSVISEEEMAKLVASIAPGDVFLPRDMVAAIRQAMRSNRSSNNPIVRAYDAMNTFAKRYALGGNVTYGPAQGGQAIFMLELVSMNGVRSAVTSILSYGLAANKQMRKAVPLSIAEDVLASTVTTQRYVENAVEAMFNQPILNKTPQFFQKPLKGMVSAYDTFVDFNLKVGAVCDSLVRAKAGIQHALLIAQENTPLGQAVREMFDTTKSLHLVETTFADPVAKMNVAKQVNNALGNFREISEMGGMKALGRITPFPAWMAFITQYTLKLPVNHPYKTVLMNNIAQLQSQYVADKNVPSYLKGAVRIAGRGPNGQPMVVVKEGMNPLTSLPQLLEAVTTAMTGQGDSSLVGMTPAPFQFIFSLMTRINPMTMKDFQDPNLLKTNSGKLYTVNDARHGNIAKRIAEPIRPLPDPGTLAMRSFFPVQARWMEAIMEKAYSNGQRSQMTGVFNSAPKRDRRTGAKKKSPDWITMMINNLVNENPIEYDPNAKVLEQRQAIQEQRQAMRDLMRRQMAP